MEMKRYNNTLSCRRSHEKNKDNPEYKLRKQFFTVVGDTIEKSNSDSGRFSWHGKIYLLRICYQDL